MRSAWYGVLSQARASSPAPAPDPEPEPEPTTYRYHRLNISANNGRSTTNVAELILRTSAGGPQAAAGGTASASTEFSIGYQAAYAFDGDASTFWSTMSGVGWLAYDLGAGNAIAVVEYAIQARDTASDGAPKSWTLEGSDNGVTWTTLDTREDVTGWTNGETKTFEVAT